MTDPSRAGVRPDDVMTDDLVWYVSYGSNMSATRLGCYLAGGRAEGALRAQPGCRDPRPAADDRPVHLPGAVYFALESPTWTGGVALYDPDADGTAAARAYLVTRGQFSDLAAQEMHRDPGDDLDLDALLTAGPGARERFGPGRYETLVHAGAIDGRAVLTFTASWARPEVSLNPPSVAYVRTLATGLRDAHGWTPDRVADYLHGCPGVALAWERDGLCDVAAAASAS